MNKHLSLFFFCCLSIQLTAQLGFTNRNDLRSGTYHSGVGLAVVDMNNDQLDDIVVLDDAQNLIIEFQQPGGANFVSVQGGSVSGNNQWSLCVADVNNDGLNDVLCGGAYDGVHLNMSSLAGVLPSYTQQDLPGQDMFIQGSNFADINNDGWIDVFACHDDAESRIWGNDGTGVLMEQNLWIDMATNPTSDNSGNYGSIWTDFDSDGDLDLYIAKCRQGVNSPTDPRRINALFVNDGMGNFTEMAEAYGLKIGAQSWTADFADIDNDGDFDCFITNHDVPSQLLENINNDTFIDITVASGINVSVLPIQGVMEDFDNDGFVDLLVSGSDEQFFKNNGDQTFTEVLGLFDNEDMESFALGDLNNDGFIDIAGGYAQIYTNPTNVDDVLWMNNANDNHYLVINPVGTISNVNGIGARIEVYGPWGVQVKEVRSGESYGICNSFSQHFGIGLETMVDSVVIEWPSGIVDVFENIPADQILTVLEDNCISPNATIAASGNTVICPGETVDIIAPSGFNYTWSNGDSTQIITVGNQGIYSVTVSDGTGCFGVSNSIMIEINPPEFPEVAILGEPVFCEGESVMLQADGNGILWSTGEVTSTIEVSTSGTYSYQVQGLCMMFESPEVTIDVLLTPAAPSVTGVSIMENETATLQATGALPHWFDLATGGTLLGTGNSYTTLPLMVNTTYYVEDHNLIGGAQASAGAPEHTGNSDYSGDIFNSEVQFEVFSAFTLKSTQVYTDTYGPRIIELSDENGTVLQSITVNIQEDAPRIDLNFELVPGNYVLSTNTASNNALFGYNSPRLKRSNSGVNYPYVTPGMVSVNNSDNGTGFYYYFYDWEIQEPMVDCIGDRVPVDVLVMPVGLDNLSTNDFKIFPQPASDMVYIELPDANQEYEMNVFDTNGKIVKVSTLSSGSSLAEINLESLTKGFYLVQLKGKDKIFRSKLLLH